MANSVGLDCSLGRAFRLGEGVGLRQNSVACPHRLAKSGNKTNHKSPNRISADTVLRHGVGLLTEPYTEAQTEGLLYRQLRPNLGDGGLLHDVYIGS